MCRRNRDHAHVVALNLGVAAAQPRRRGGLSVVALAVEDIGGVDSRPLVLTTTGAFVLVYPLGTAAAVRLLPRGTLSCRGAVVALLAVAVLVV
ncbi:MAG TPA: hypothetical protein VFY84_04875, partial [Jiangellales bacterium]|nr:hypothetical protein [Jiangellales bacterium]